MATGKQLSLCLLLLQSLTAFVRILELAKLLREVVDAFDQVQPHLVVIQLFKVSLMKFQVHLHVLDPRLICMGSLGLRHSHISLSAIHVEYLLLLVVRPRHLFLVGHVSIRSVIHHVIGSGISISTCLL